MISLKFLLIFSLCLQFKNGKSGWKPLFICSFLRRQESQRTIVANNELPWFKRVRQSADWTTRGHLLWRLPNVLELQTNFDRHGSDLTDGHYNSQQTVHDVFALPEANPQADRPREGWVYERNARKGVRLSLRQPQGGVNDRDVIASWLKGFVLHPKSIDLQTRCWGVKYWAKLVEPRVVIGHCYLDFGEFLWLGRSRTHHHAKRDCSWQDQSVEKCGQRRFIKHRHQVLPSTAQDLQQFPHCSVQRLGDARLHTVLFFNASRRQAAVVRAQRDNGDKSRLYELRRKPSIPDTYVFDERDKNNRKNWV